jgi:sugar phosphate permease/protein-tyrosine-phosphatase
MENQRWSRIVPAALVMYTLAYIDRTNIALALPALSAELHMDLAQAGAAAGVFCWGYVALQIPAAYLASRWSARRTIAILLASCSLVSISTGFVHTYREFWTMRLLLGVTEGGLWPATLVLLAHWFPRHERARAHALWMLCLPASLVISSPLSGWILGNWGWRALLVGEGALPLAWLAVWLSSTADHPREARWISADERAYLATTLAREAATLSKPAQGGSWRALVRPRVALMAAVAFLLYAGLYGLMFWLPTALRSVLGRSGPVSNLTIGVANAVPYVAAAIVMLLVSRHSDRRGERRGHVAMVLLCGGGFLVAATALGSARPALGLACLLLAAASPVAALAPLYAIPSETLPPALAGTAMGLVCALGNLGGYYGPALVGQFARSTGRLSPGFTVLGLGLLGGAALAAFLPASGRSLGVLQRTFVFVCSGNTGRSPIAQAICNAEIARRLRVPLELLGEARIQAVSAGLSARPGSPLTPEAAQALSAIGVAGFDHRSRQLTPEMAIEAEGIFCMTEKQRHAAVALFPQAAAKIHCLSSEGDLDDPTGGGPEVFLELARRIQGLVRERLDQLNVAAI